MTPEICCLFGILLFTHTVQAITGFGSTILAVTIAGNFIPLGILLPLLVSLNLGLNLYLLLFYPTYFEKKLFFQTLIPWALIGMIPGMFLFEILPKKVLLSLLGSTVVFLAAFEILANKKSKKEKVLDNSMPSPLWLIGGGFIQGLYATGGPLLVYYLAKVIPAKKAFRTTISVLFLLLNSILLFKFISLGKINIQTLPTILILSPTLLIGIWTGEKLHNRIPETTFRYMVYWLLLIGGGILLLRNLFGFPH
ncbi:MAG: sulfite exporter TauE/SafE family protein [Planctomycetota bacterium]|nr:MAG: sulfite exporter TauE/SafE family protein [Planctomycetota bacterium]